MSVLDSTPDVTNVPVPNPGGARWCPEHRRLECVYQRRNSQGTCHAPAIRGTKGCKVHVGFKREVAIAQGQAVITAWNATGGAANIDYRMAVLGVLQMTWMRLAAYGELLRRQVAIEGDQAGDPGQERRPEASGLIGYRYGAAGKDGVVYVQSEEVRALVALESAERDRVVKYAKTAHDMGISDRLINLAEKWGDAVATRISEMLADPRLNHTPEQAAMVPRLIQDHLGSFDVESMGAPK